MMTPTIHSNGTARDELLRQLEEAWGALNDARMVLQMAEPHSRDYYPQGPDAFRKAQSEHRERLRKIDSVNDELRALLESIAFAP